jgi:hypothetical protein
MKFNSAPSYINEKVKYYTVVSKYYTTQVLDCYKTTYAAPAYYTEASKYYSVPSYYTEIPAYYVTKAFEYYT